jgi:hypothetical protein
LRSSKKLLTPANILLVNLAISDLLIISMIPIFLYNSFLQGPAIGGLGMIENISFLDLLFFFYHVYNILDFIFNAI